MNRLHHILTRALFGVLLFLILLPDPLYALEETIRLGREEGWTNPYHYGTEENPEGFRGFADIELLDASYGRDEATDLLLHFEGSADRVFWDQSPGYLLEPRGIELDDEMRVFGRGAGLFSAGKSSLRLIPQRGSLFYPGSDWRDFTIEFWLYPAETESRQTIIHWEGVTRPDEWGEMPRPQELSCRIGDNRLSWSFTNIFRPFDTRGYELELTGSQELLPRRWNHHAVRFDSATGLIEYLVNGRVEDFAYANYTDREDGIVFLPFLGSAGKQELFIGGELDGLLDELRISSIHRDEIPPALYTARRGEVVLPAQDLGYGRSRLVSIDTTQNTPADSDIFYYYQLREDPFPLRPENPGWIPFTAGAIFSPEVRGRYLHLMAALYPDGKEQLSPVLSDVTITYEPDLPPPPPSGLSAVAGNASVRLRWDPVPDPDLEGYRIYYGTSPGRYFGEGSESGPSPVDVGTETEFLLEGLENGRLYYFSVVAYDGSVNPYQTVFSREVSARPRRLEPAMPGGEP